MGIFSTILGILGFSIGLSIGLVLGFFIFVYSKPKHVEDPVVKPLVELDSDALENILPELPLWVKCPDYERVDWLNKFILRMWPYLDKAICAIIRTTAQPIFAEYVGKYGVEAIDFEHLSLGTLPPTVHGIKIFDTNENNLVLETAVRWAGNPNITLMLKFMSLPITVQVRITLQLIDLQVFAEPRISLKPLVSTFPCFANIVVSLMDRPHVDFGLKISGGDIMSIPGLYRFVQETIKKQVASMYLWPHTLEIPVLDPSTGVKKPVGILHVKVVRAMKLMKADIIGTSDPYVKLSLSGENLPAKKTTIKKHNLNPIWNEQFRLIVKDPGSQVLQLEVIDWDKVGGHDTLGMQVVPLRILTPQETMPLTLDLLKSTDTVDSRDKKQRGQLVVELILVPFKEDSRMSSSLDEHQGSKGNGYDSLNGSGLLSVTVQSAEDVEGQKHNNPYAIVLFRGERKRTKMMRKTRDPRWNEEFQFMIDQPPLREKIHVEVLSKRTSLSFRSRESLGYVEVNLDDVVYNGRMNEKYHLINSKNGMIHVEIQWDTL
ncbi:SYT3 [Linum perenne]